MGILNIPNNPQYGVIVESDCKKEKTLFYDVYQSAAKNVFDILTHKETNKNELFMNPCIAFVGKRGTGKSSAMSSFAKFLEESKKNNCEWIDDKSIRDRLSKAKFYPLSAIDTANMEENETIISDVSAIMFSEYEKSNDHMLIEEKRAFLKITKETNDTAIMKSSGEWIKKGDQLLNETNKIVNIKKSFTEMVDCFLKVVKKNASTEDCYLVIQIDDLDMNISNAYSIMEEIRTILSVRNVIVLLSVDIEQLKTVLRIKYEEPLKNITLFEELECNSKKSRIAKDLAYKYIEKVIPVNKRHYMPELTTTQLINTKSSNFLGDGDKSWFDMGLAAKEGNAPNILDAALHLIWRKTMLIPMKNEYGDFLLLPHNLRSLCNFIVFLRNMDDAAYSIEEKSNEEKVSLRLTYFDYADKVRGQKYRSVLEKNLRDFSKYIISNLETYQRPEMTEEDNNLSDLLLVIIESLSNVNTSEINTKIVNDILTENKSTKSCLELQEVDDANSAAILKSIISYDMVSLGDLMYILRRIDKKTHCEYVRYLVSVIRYLWSIKMTHELYVVGCNPNKTNNFGLTKSNFITKVFRSNVGTMIINPDVTETFFSEHKTYATDWSVSKQKSFQSIYDLILPQNEVVFAKNNKVVEKVLEHRMKFKTGETVYEFYSDKKTPTLYKVSHPMCIFSNLLYPALVMNKNGKFIDWQNKYIMAFPFNSMDYMYRLVEKYFEEINKKHLDGTTSIMRFVIDTFKEITSELLIEIKNYIPIIENSFYRTEINSYTTDSEHSVRQIFKVDSDLIFTEPIKRLSEDFSWDNELVLVNSEFITFLKNNITALKNDSAKKENEVIIYINNLSNYISTVLPAFLNEKITTLQSVTEKIKFLEELVHTLSGYEPNSKNVYLKTQITPFFYSEKVEIAPYNKRKPSSKGDGNGN